MAERPPRARGLFELLSAYRELSSLEWQEFRKTLLEAACWAACAAIGGGASWVALNVAAFIALRHVPLGAALALAGLNLLGATVAGWRVSRLLRRPFFALTRREATHEAGQLFKALS